MSACQELIVIIRPSFKKFCGNDPCQAALFNHLLYWIAQKARGQDQGAVQEGRVYWYGTAEEICAGLDNSWSINKIRKELKALVEAGFIGQCRNPVKGWDQTRHYFIGLAEGNRIRETCEKYGICLLHLGLRPDVLHLLNVVNAFDKNGKCSCETGEMDTTDLGDESDKNGNSIYHISEMDTPNMVAPFTTSGNAIPKDTSKVSSKVFPRKDEHRGEGNVPEVHENSSLSDLGLWITERKIRLSKDKISVHKQKQELMGDLTTRERFEDLYRLAEEEVNQSGKDGIVRLGNLVALLPKCRLQWQEQIAKDRNAPMNHDQADAFAQKLIQQGWSSDVIHLEQPYGADRNIWTVCIQYAEGEWLPFGNEDHFNNPPTWERERIEQAIRYGQTLSSQQLVG